MNLFESKKLEWVVSKVTIVAILAEFVFFQAVAQPATFVIHVSVDGLRPDAITALGEARAPNFYRLRNQGAFTDNARCDYDFSVTLPNHTSQLTGRGVTGTTGHGWTSNVDPDPGQTLASNKGSYVAGVFDVAHDNGLRTGEYASKSKFVLFASSWDELSGAQDLTGPDNGRNKIDAYTNLADTSLLMDQLVEDMATSPFNYVFLHLADPDRVGHGSGWDITPGSDYSNAILAMDSRLGALFAMIDSTPQLTGHTAIILTADHGGSDFNHSDATLPDDYTIPFYVWGPGVFPGADLYVLNPTTRLDPSLGRPTYDEAVQPIRNGEAANVALQLFGLNPVPSSTLNAAQDLALTVAPPKDFRLTRGLTNATVSFALTAHLLYDLKKTDNLLSGTWTNVVTNISGPDGMITNIEIGPLTQPQEFHRLKLHY